MSDKTIHIDDHDSEADTCRKEVLPADGIQQAKDYAQILGLKFAYSTNGTEILEFDFIKTTY